MSDLQRCVLVVDDEYLIAQGLRLQVEDMGLNVCGTAATVETAVALARAHRPSVVLMDVRLRGKGDGVDAAIEIHFTVGSRVIFITGSREPATVDRIGLDHPSAVLFKPLFGRQLQSAIEAALTG
jgi:DNA-binding NarL/FixJ family response regulator